MVKLYFIDYLQSHELTTWPRFHFCLVVFKTCSEKQLNPTGTLLITASGTAHCSVPVGKSNDPMFHKMGKWQSSQQKFPNKRCWHCNCYITFGGGGFLNWSHGGSVGSWWDLSQHPLYIKVHWEAWMTSQLRSMLCFNYYMSSHIFSSQSLHSNIWS